MPQGKCSVVLSDGPSLFADGIRRMQEAIECDARPNYIALASAGHATDAGATEWRDTAEDTQQMLRYLQALPEESGTEIISALSHRTSHLCARFQGRVWEHIEVVGDEWLSGSEHRFENIFDASGRARQLIQRLSARREILPAGAERADKAELDAQPPPPVDTSPANLMVSRY